MKKNGFTLFEMVLVLGLLALGFLPLILMFSNGINSSSDTTSTMTAIQLAQQKMEQIKNLNYSSISASTEASGTISDYPAFSRTTAVSEDLLNLKNITVTVSWTSGPKSDSVNLSTYLSNY